MRAWGPDGAGDEMEAKSLGCGGVHMRGDDTISHPLFAKLTRLEHQAAEIRRRGSLSLFLACAPQDCTVN